MSFGSNGTYTNVAGATTAGVGDVIRSSVWDAIHTDIGSALTTLGQGVGFVATPRTISSPGTITVTATDSVILVQATCSIINLPLSNTRTYPVKIMGAATGFFSAHNSTLTPAGADTISGLATVVLNVDLQVVTLYPLASGGYILD